MPENKSIISPIQLVLFDCDGVLVNSEEIAFEAELAYLASLGLVYSGPEYQELFSGLTHAAFRALMRDQYMKRTGKILPDSVFDELTAHYRAIEKTALKSPEGLTDVLDALEKKRIPYAVVTNGEWDSTERKLRMVGVMDRFKGRMFNKDMVARPKPAPDVYLHAMHKMGFSDPARCLVIEDSLTGATAAVSAGMQVIGFVHGAHRPLGHDQHLLRVGVGTTATGMAQILDIISRLNP